MIRCGIVGGTGYTAIELVKILLRHPHADVTCMTSREHEGAPVHKVHPQLFGQLDLNFDSFEPDQVVGKIDFAFCCLPHAASARSVMALRERGVRVIDFSADYRLSSQPLYEQWYEPHPHPEQLGSTPYGLPEFFAAEIAAADLVANPGCFPTSAILPTVPLIKAGLIKPDLIVDSKTGVSGAGRKPNLPFHYPECNESTLAYKAGSHRHQPEIVDLVHRATGTKAECLFTPHLVPMDRGILSTIYADLNGSATAESILETLRDAYSDAPFVRVVEDFPSTKQVSGTNFCDITARVHGNRVILISCVDNLIKGASGAAVQNFNVMNHFDETTGLL